MATAPLWRLSAVELAARFGSGDATPSDALESVLVRAEAVDGRLNALVTIDREGARRAASASTARRRAGRALGPLDGVPITIKDNIPVAGLRSTWGSRLYGEWVPERDETPILRLREAGAVILGKTNVPEMTLQGYTSNPVFGTTRNPWNPELTPGGSSGGAVAAVASGIGPIAIGTDGGGSIRRPASHAGLLGLKPTGGRVPRRDGFPPILLDLEVIGPMARSAADLALAMSVIARPDPDGVPASSFAPFPSRPEPVPGGLRILFAPTFSGAPVDPEIAASVAEAADGLARLGHRIEIAGSFGLADPINAAFPQIGQAGMAWLMRQHPDRLDALGPAIRAVAEAGAKLAAADLFDALHEALVLRAELARLFTRHDLILTPSAAALPWPAGETHPSTIAGQPVGPRGSAIFTAFCNASGCPAISIPCRPSRAGMPIGFQLVGPWGADALLVGMAAAWENAHPWTPLASL